MLFRFAGVRSLGGSIIIAVSLSFCSFSTSASDSSFSPWGEQGLRGYLEGFVEVPLDVFGGIYSRTAEGDLSTLLAWGAVGGAFLLDEPVRETWQNGFTSEWGDDVSALFDATGRSTVLLAGIGLTLGTSYLIKNEDLAQTTALALQSFAVAQSVTALTKYTAGRLRPHESGGDAGEWRAGSTSFFSAHSSGTWSVATVIAHRYPNSRVVPVLAYGWATATVVSRINDDMHFLSDVVVGSLWGYLVGRSVMGISPLGERAVSLTPMSRGDALGLAFSMEF